MKQTYPGLRSRRRRRTPQRRAELLTQYRRSGSSQCDFVQSHGLGLSTLTKWLGQERPGPAAEVVSEIRKLYLVERHARDACLPPAERLALRKKISEPLLTALKPQLVSLQEASLPQSPLGKAARYALGEWGPLTRYLEDGRLEIDNNLTENAIRPSAVGKKNWLFIGHPEAGWRSATIYSVIVNCRRRGIDPWEYLRDVLTRLPSMKQSELTTVLPRNWKPA